MNRNAFIQSVWAALLGGLGLAACETVAVRTDSKRKSPGHGPPPHAPAHGYRAKNEHGLTVEFDAAKGVYVVVRYPGTFYASGKYYRPRGNSWEVSERIDGGWVTISEGKVPPGLRVKSSGGKQPSKGKGGGKGKQHKKS